MKFYRNAEIEQIAEEQLRLFAEMTGRPLVPPIPVDLMAEKLFGLSILWEPIKEEPGEFVFGGLNPKEKMIVLNEKHRAFFEEKPGVERSTIGHEIGHWQLFIDKGSIDHPLLPGMTLPDSFVRRDSSKRSVEVIRALIGTEKGQEALRQLNSRSDHPDEARAVNRFAAAISMPRDLIKSEALKIDRTEWRNLYRLAEKFGVSITALKVRLSQFDLLFVDDNGTIFPSRDAAKGQMQLRIE